MVSAYFGYLITQMSLQVPYDPDVSNGGNNDKRKMKLSLTSSGFKLRTETEVLVCLVSYSIEILVFKSFLTLIEAYNDLYGDIILGVMLLLMVGEGLKQLCVPRSQAF